MRRVLVLGGTGWLGRATVRQLLDDGDEVTCLARGHSGDVPDAARLVPVDRRDPGAYDRVRGDWDEVIEFAYDPELVLPALDALAHSAAHWTLVSSVSVYERNDEPGADESAALVRPSDLTQYPDAKVAAEHATVRQLGDRGLIARPGLIVGPGDPSDRFGYWPARFSRSGPVLLPVQENRFVQVIDVADLAAWIAGAGRRDVVGAVNAVGEALPMGDVFRIMIEVAEYEGDVVEVGDDALLAQDVHYWAGPRSLPLWLPVSDAGFAQRSGRRFRESGGMLAQIAETITAVLADERVRGVDRQRRAGLTVAEERAVLAGIR